MHRNTKRISIYERGLPISDWTLKNILWNILDSLPLELGQLFMNVCAITELLGRILSCSVIFLFDISKLTLTNTHVRDLVI